LKPDHIVEADLVSAQDSGSQLGVIIAGRYKIGPYMEDRIFRD